MLFSVRMPSFLLLSCFVFLISACQSDNSSNPKTDSTSASSKENQTAGNQTTKTIRKVASLRPVISSGDAKNIQPAFLRDHLPESAFAYARIPNFWSLIGSAKGNVFDTALNAKPFVDAITGIRSGVVENVIPEIPDEAGQLITKLLLKNLTSPIEAIAIPGVDPVIPTPNLVITTSADFNSVSEIQELLELLAEKSPVIEIRKVMDVNGYAELSIVNNSTQLQWDKEKSRLTLLIGVSLSPNNLSDLLITFVPNSNHQMKALEKTIDTSGQGTFVWADPRKLTSVASTLGMQRELAPLAMMGVNTMKNIAIGEGTSNGIKRLKYVVEMPVTGFRSYMPIMKTAPEFFVMGKTKLVSTFAIPSRADFVSIENTIALVSNAKDMESYYKAKKKFNEVLGFDIEDIFDFFGQDISYVSDEAGSYIAVRLNDAEKFKNTLDKSVGTLGLEYKQREIAGHTYHHLKIPSIYKKYLEEEQASKKSRPETKLLNRFLSMPSHIYWEQEGDYLIFSNIPQTLIDRHYIKTKTPVKDWLEKQQRMNSEGALLMASVRNEGTAQKMYRIHLGILNFLADFSGKPIDMFALATPIEADIPKESSYGVKVTSTDTQLAFELNYESHPYEFLLAGSVYQGIVVLGILSSIAVPAFADYELKSTVISGITSADMIKLELNEFEIEYGRYPNQYEIEDLKLNKKTSKHSITVKPNTGNIEIKYQNRKLRGTRNLIKVLPPKQGESTTWTCDTRMNKKYLPAKCKNQKR